MDHLASDARFAAIVTAIEIGGRPSGLDILAEARRRQPQAARVLISGRAHPDEMEESLTSGLVDHFVQAPWAPGAVAAALFGKTNPTARGQASQSSDRCLAERIRSDDDDDAIGILLDRYAAVLLYRIQRLHGVPAQDAEDVLQDTYRRFVKARRKVKHVGGVLKLMAERASIDYHRKRNHDKRLTEDYLKERFPRPYPFKSGEARFLDKLDIQLALSAARGGCRELFDRIFLRGSTHAEFAEEKGVGRGNVGTTLARCIQQVRRTFRRRKTIMRFRRLA